VARIVGQSVLYQNLNPKPAEPVTL
jgi:hypothetical protein